MAAHVSVDPLQLAWRLAEPSIAPDTRARVLEHQPRPVRRAAERLLCAWGVDLAS
ncbi:MAG: hypothetical protein S0880_22490 [Actinomycetota bacterium]|nr:hypothetical protein [Actinomycetota bacterium]